MNLLRTVITKLKQAHQPVLISKSPHFSLSPVKNSVHTPDVHKQNSTTFIPGSFVQKEQQIRTTDKTSGLRPDLTQSYFLPLTQLQFVPNSFTNTSFIWHLSLNNLSLNFLKQNAKFRNIPGLHSYHINTNQHLFHSVWYVEKQVSAPHYRTTEYSIDIGRTVKIDIMGLIFSLSISGLRYLLVVADIFSRLIRTTPPKCRAEAIQSMDNIIITIRAEDNISVREIMTDRGCVFFG